MRLVHKHIDGSIHISTFTSQKPSEQDIARTIANMENLNGEYLDHVFVEDDQLPQDRYFRNAWNHDLGIDLDKAKEIHLNTLRRLRAPKLKELDILYLQADEKEDLALKQEIKNKKQALRDVTTIDLPSDLIKLKTSIPDILL